MPDTETYAVTHACERCRAMDAAVPTEAQLRMMAHEDWDPKTLTFIPRAMNQEQAVASEMLTSAFGRFVKAYGLETAGARLGAYLTMLRGQVAYARAVKRVLEARSDINARVRAAWEQGDTDAVRAIEDEPTPDYPGKARDEQIIGGSV